MGLHRRKRPRTLPTGRPNSTVENIVTFLVALLMFAGFAYAMNGIRKTNIKSEKARQAVIQKDKKCRNGCYNKGYPRWDREGSQCWCLNSTKVVRLGE